VRRTVRPFIKEFKTRSAKSPGAHPRPISGADNDGSKPSLLDRNVFTTRQNKFDDEHKVALTAANAVFEESSPGAPLPQASPLSNSPVGRVLPSHIGEDDLLTVRLTKGDGKSRSGRRVGKVKSSFSVRFKKPTRQPEGEVAGDFLERPATSFSPDKLIVSTPRRERRSIQKRWVLRTELKAGEKWKRRLCKAAR
jgi:hypothetical protein